MCQYSIFNIKIDPIQSNLIQYRYQPGWKELQSDTILLLIHIEEINIYKSDIHLYRYSAHAHGDCPSEIHCRNSLCSLQRLPREILRGDFAQRFPQEIATENSQKYHRSIPLELTSGLGIAVSLYFPKRQFFMISFSE